MDGRCGGVLDDGLHTHTSHTCESLVVCGLSWMDGWRKRVMKVRSVLNFARNCVKA